jgi:hypothetical protein
MSTWPIELPLPNIADYSGTQEQAFIRTDFDSGYARQRQRFTATPQYRSVQWVFNTLQMYAFKDFFYNTIGLGTNWFEMELDIGDGIDNYDCRFNSPYEDVMISPNLWRVSGKLEVRER